MVTLWALTGFIHPDLLSSRQLPGLPGLSLSARLMCLTDGQAMP